MGRARNRQAFSTPFVLPRAKAPRSELESGNRKTPRGAPPDVEADRPLWSFRMVDLGGPWCWSNMDARCIRDVMGRLKSFETMTWKDIEGPSGSHFIEVSRCAKEARDRLRALQHDDVAMLFSLRVSARARVFGIRERRVLRILWWDPGHQVCPSAKKHT